MEKECFDVTIIGGGPAGLYSAFYSGLREMKTKIIEFQPQLGGKVQIYPEKMVWDVGGLPPVPGKQLMDQMIEQGLTFNPEVVPNEKVVSISRDETDTFLLEAASGRVHYSKTVIVAVGSGILMPQKLNIEGAERFELGNLHYTVKSLKTFKDKTVIISGGGNSAIDWANELEPVAKKVYLAYRKDCLNGHEAQITQLENSSVECFPYTTISKLLASEDHETISQVELTSNQTSESFYLEVDDVIVNHGFDQDTSLLKNTKFDIQLVDQYFVKGTATSETSVEGVYAAGDILNHEGKLNLIAGAFQDAANAVNKAKQFIEPDANAVAMVSSHNDVFKKRNRELVRELTKS
ncbi:ferredoxin--NADP reductase 1 [Thalassobacillus devorans]|uniref:Ferredoxin--NADP reductase n=1 Tax=Thalassobacillus devorans TaxID=279813 RepID=A0ABQ1NGT3_9BACI|nr:NAD(P)/FAD-dependent oxidoreductase [Thalassobacillus devorans]NIK27304.1 thioredoxin reductase (NADPH) [Thalassobacillus devorans]GGC76597.1 ferredoxin--NADP reductase 1 [Thalassobacillus devorans]